jgi:phosphatidate cytidylyltransferase
VAATVAAHAPAPVDEHLNKWASWKTRTFSTVIMVGSFALIVWSGHVTIMAMTAGLLVLVYSEVMNIGYNTTREKKPPSWWLQWYVWMWWFPSPVLSLIDA